jgi:KEOPS complex subunit Pcc1
MRAEFIFEMDEELARIICKSLKTEDGDKSRAKIYLERGKLVLTLEADDLTALRATVNAWLRLVNVCKEVIGVLE